MTAPGSGFVVRVRESISDADLARLFDKLGPRRRAPELAQAFLLRVLREAWSKLGHPFLIGGADIGAASSQRPLMRRLAKNLAAVTKDLAQLDTHSAYALRLLTDPPPLWAQQTPDLRVPPNVPGAVHRLAARLSTAVQALVDNPVKDVPELHARILADIVVRIYVDLFMELPPRKKDSWFASFVKALAKHFDLVCGDTITTQAIDAVAADRPEIRAPRAGRPRRK